MTSTTRTSTALSGTPHARSDRASSSSSLPPWPTNNRKGGSGRGDDGDDVGDAGETGEAAKEAGRDSCASTTARATSCFNSPTVASEGTGKAGKITTPEPTASRERVSSDAS
jgi:hypothetical protein